jgi:hypothetical protein
MAATKAQTFVSGGSEAKQGVIPVMNGEDSFSVVGSHKYELLRCKSQLSSFWGWFYR